MAQRKWLEFFEFSYLYVDKSDMFATRTTRVVIEGAGHGLFSKRLPSAKVIIYKKLTLIDG